MLGHCNSTQPQEVVRPGGGAFVYVLLVTRSVYILFEIPVVLFRADLRLDSESMACPVVRRPYVPSGYHVEPYGT